MKKNLDVIAAVPLFNGLPPDQLEAIKNIAIEKKISKGEVRNFRPMPRRLTRPSFGFSPERPLST
jgi:hypothetical protein